MMEQLEELLIQNQEILIRLRNEEEHEETAWYRKDGIKDDYVHR